MKLISANVRAYIGLLSSFLLIVVPPFVEANPTELAKAIVYYHDWGAELRGPLSSDQLRVRYFKKLELTDPADIEELIETLSLRRLVEKNIKISEQDIRLAIDLFKLDGSVESFYASRRFLFSAGGGYSRPLDIDFSEKFSIELVVD